MRLAISNIAWPTGADAEALPLLKEHGVAGVELALTKIWPEPLAATAEELDKYRAWLESRGLSIVALQALLFGKPDLLLFGSPSAREAMHDYLVEIIRRAARLGAGALVFGSPGNRKHGNLDSAAAFAVAIPFFRRLGEVAAQHGVAVCIEPNPPAYGCDWITTVREAIELVDAVSSAGFGLHLDSAGMHLAGDGAAAVLAAGSRVRHFHASAPFLEGVSSGDVPHGEYAAALADQGHRGWVSIEMAEPKLRPTWQEGVRTALGFVRQTYSRGRQQDHTSPER
jgi:sugar phosphate isomerase/epimerase